MRIRYTGPNEAVDLAVPGCCVRFERGQWVDIEEALDEANVPRFHAEIVVRGLVDAPGWELDGDLVLEQPERPAEAKPKRKRGAKKPKPGPAPTDPPTDPATQVDPTEADPPTEPDTPADPPASPDEEQS